MRVTFLSLSALLLGALAAPAGAASKDVASIDNIARELSAIRQEIGELHDQINSERQVFSDQMRSLANQKADLEIRISRQQLNLKDLNRELATLKESRRQQTTPDAQVVPVVLEEIAALRKQLDSSVPFRLEDRLDVLREIEKRLTSGAISSNKAINQLWAFVEDELTMGRSSGIHSETLDVNGAPTLARVLRLGKIAMFYTLEEGKYGLVRQELVSGSWQHEEITASSDVALLDKLFDAYAKNIRTGLFVVPNLLPRK